MAQKRDFSGVWDATKELSHSKIGVFGGFCGFGREVDPPKMTQKPRKNATQKAAKMPKNDKNAENWLFCTNLHACQGIFPLRNTPIRARNYNQKMD
jgi:hypothetical protein